MIVEAALAVLAMKPFAWQREALARDLLAAVAADYVRAEHRAAVAGAACEVVPKETGPEYRYPELRHLTVVCRVEMPCGGWTGGAIFYQPLRGVTSGAFDIAHDLYLGCPAMLTDEGLDLVEDQLRGDG